jgi:BirA family biotin operon repressor/biotin-[acetyl-CoA-carboxylase] ligase
MNIKIIKLKSAFSTNDEAIKLIQKNKINPTIIFTDHQTKGRGTMGKKWVSLKGNLFLSIFFNLNKKRIDFKKIAAINPYIIRNILKNYTKFKIKIKKPNDLLIKDKKLSGILQETVYVKDQKYLIIGVGINTFKHPVKKSFKSTSLSNYAFRPVKNEYLLKDIKKAYDQFISDMNKYKITYLKKKFCLN